MSESDTFQKFSKQEIVRNFGDAAEYYQQHAQVQKDVAKRLIASLEPWRDILPPGPILEVGCGTGFVTKGLIDLYPERKKMITDLSPGMVKYCRERFNNALHTDFAVMDADELSTEEPVYAMTVSGFTAQWFSDPPLTLGRLMEATRPGGLLLASFPGNQSFPEWREHCKELGIPYTANPLPDTEEIVIKMSTGPVQVDYYEDTVTQYFDSAADFFHHIKRLGAGVRRRGRKLSPSEMKLLINHWDQQAGDQVKISYHVIFLAVKRDYNS